MTSLVYSPLVSSGRKRPGGTGCPPIASILFRKPGHLDLVFTFLKGTEVLRIASVCTTFRLRIVNGGNKDCEYLWRQLFHTDFQTLTFDGSGSTSTTLYQTRYERAHSAMRFKNLRFYQVTDDRNYVADRERPHPRQGAAGCTLTTINRGEGGFVVLGGWTSYGMSPRLSILYSPPQSKPLQTAKLPPSCCKKSASQASRCKHYEHPEGCSGSSTITPSTVSLEEGASSLKKRYSWRTETIIGRIPRQDPTPYGHSLTRIEPGVLDETNEAMITYGGVTQGGYRGEINALNAIIICPAQTHDESDRFYWRRLNEDFLYGRPRAYHTAVYVRSDMTRLHSVHPEHVKKMFVFGGFSGDGAMSSLELINLGLHTSTAEMFTAEGVDFDIGGEGPVARFGHSSCVLSGHLFIMGGSTGSSNYKGQTDGQELCDMWLLDLKVSQSEWAWSLVQNTAVEIGSVLQRCHSAVPIDHGNKILCFGGGAPGNVINSLSVYDVNRNEWTLEIPTAGRLPRGRQNHSVGLLPGGTKMVIFGGALALPYGAEELGDCFILDFDGGIHNQDAIWEDVIPTTSATSNASDETNAVNDEGILEGILGPYMASVIREQAVYFNMSPLTFFQMLQAGEGAHEEDNGSDDDGSDDDGSDEDSSDEDDKS